MQNPSKSSEPQSPFSNCFETFFQENGKYYFQFLDEEGVAMFFGKAYSSEKGRDNGIQAVIRSATQEERYDTQKNKKGSHYFVLKSGNHKEIGRSALYDSEAEMQEKMKLLQQVDKATAIVARTEQAVPKEAPSDEPQTVNQAADPPPETSQIQTVDEARSRADKSDQMARYKFTLIYYPDSGIWMCKNDFSGASKQLKSWNAQVLQQFIKEQFPEEEQQTVFPTVAVTPPAKLSPKPAPKPIPLKRSKEIRITIQNKNGEPVKQMAASENLGSVELAALSEGNLLTARFGGRIFARSIDSQKEYLLGLISGEKFQEGRLVIPILDGKRLRPGSYLFMVDVDEEGHSEEAVKLVGRQVLMLN